jgi:parvulin-like peptidyl-prolyl isomerase
MNRHYLIAAALLLTSCLAPLSLWAGTVVDRIVATVNSQIILQSDWDDAVGYQGLVDNRPLVAITADERKAALDHLIDQELLKEQMNATDFRHASEEEIAQRISEIRQQHPAADGPEGWSKLLARYGLTEGQVKQQVAAQIELMRLVDERLRPNVKIDSSTIESYYNQELLPQLRQSGAGDVPLADVTTKIKELLTQQKVNELLLAWLHNLRSGSDIRTEPETGSAGENLR